MDGIYNSLQMEDITDQYDPAEMEQQKGVSIVAFLVLLFFVPLLSNKDSAYAKAVANQSLTLCVAEVAVYILRMVLGGIPVLGKILGLVLGVATLALLVLAVLKIIDVVNGKFRKMPFGIEISAFK